MSVVEIVATVFGLACVFLYVRQNVWSWPTGLVQVVLFVWVFYRAKLYSDVLLHLVYIALQIYGWYHWVYGGPKKDELPITRLTPNGFVLSVSIAAIGTLVLGTLMHRLFGASLPYWDAAIASISLVAQYLIARKVLENWLFWIVVDVLAIGVYLAKDLYVTTVLYAVFLCMAAAGWFAWRKSFRQGGPRGFDVVAA